MSKKHTHLEATEPGDVITPLVNELNRKLEILIKNKGKKHEEEPEILVVLFTELEMTRSINIPITGLANGRGYEILSDHSYTGAVYVIKVPTPGDALFLLKRIYKEHPGISGFIEIV